MASLPISSFSTESDLSLISGLAGFKTGTPNTNVRISGSEIIASVSNSILPIDISSGAGEVTGVLSASNGGTGVGGLTEGNIVVGEGSGSALSTITSKGKGNLVVGRTVGVDDSTGVIPVGTNGQVLTADSSVTEYGVKWADAPTSLPVSNSNGVVQFTSDENTGIRFLGSGGTTVSFTAASKLVTFTGAPAPTITRLPDTPDQDIYNDGNIYVKLNDSNVDDIQAQVLTDPSSGFVTFTWESSYGTPNNGGIALDTTTGTPSTLNGNFGNYQIMRLNVFAQSDSTYPYYEFTFTKGAGATDFITKVNKYT